TPPRFRIQMQMFANGDLRFVYATPIVTSEPADTYIVGFTPGGNHVDPGNRDYDVLGAFNSGVGRRPPVLGLSARLVIGTNFIMTTSNLNLATVFNMFILGTAPIPGGL